MRKLTIALILTLLISSCLAEGQEPKTAKDKSALHLEVASEDSGQPKVEVELRTRGGAQKVIKKLEAVLLGESEMTLSDVPDGDYFVWFSSKGYASQWQMLAVKEGKAEPETIKAKLFRKRFVVMRYAFNTAGGRSFTGEGVIEGRATVDHWGNLPYFQHDWQIWQRSSGKELFGDTPFLEFHRFSKGFGFAKAPKSLAFEDLKEAPAETEYKCESMRAEKGLILFCRVEGNRKAGLGYGKVIVEDVTETPPEGVKEIDERGK